MTNHTPSGRAPTVASVLAKGDSAGPNELTDAVSLILATAVNEALGPRCTVFDSDCMTCNAWKAVDLATSAAALSTTPGEQT